MEAIAGEAAVSKGGLYRHFASKDELFLTIAARAAIELEELLQNARESHEGSGYSTLEACVARIVSFARGKEGKVKLALDCSSIRDLVDPRCSALPAFDSAVRELIQLGFEILRRGQEDGSVRSDVQVQALAVGIWGAVVGALQLERNLGNLLSRGMLPGDRFSMDLATVIASSARACNMDAVVSRQEMLGERSGTG